MQALSICTQVCDGFLGWQLWQLMLDRSFLLTCVLMTYHAVRMKWRHQVISSLETENWAPEYSDIREWVFQSKKILYRDFFMYLCFIVLTCCFNVLGTVDNLLHVSVFCWWTVHILKYVLKEKAQPMWFNDWASIC